MRRDTGRLKADSFDILVIGAGINGCAIARDASLRGAKTALIEKNDFASGASGKTTKLIHGGIRYLEQFNFKLVYEALHERAILLLRAPHLVKPLEFIIPVYKDDPRSLLKIRTGVFLYDQLAGKENIRRHQSLKKDELMSLEPNIDSRNLKGGVIYCDAQVDDIRLCLDNAISACKAGCVAANKIEAVGFIKENGKIVGVEAKDNLSQERFSIRATLVINATGAWSNGILKMDEPDAYPITRPTKGVHIIYKKLPHQRAILLSARKDKRVFFVIPWRNLTLIGTTDTDYTGSADEVYATFDEVEYLLREARRVFPGENIGRKDIITTYASLRPLVNPALSNFVAFLRSRKGGVNTQRALPWQVSREHLIKESGAGLISVVGGKYTTYRHLAQAVVDKALSKLGGNFKKCITATIGPSPSILPQKQMELKELVENAVKEEMANSLTDLLARRLEFSTMPSHGFQHLEECARVMGRIFGWTDAQKETEIIKYKEEVKKNMNFFLDR